MLVLLPSLAAPRRRAAAAGDSEDEAAAGPPTLESLQELAERLRRRIQAVSVTANALANALVETRKDLAKHKEIVNKCINTHALTLNDLQQRIPPPVPYIVGDSASARKRARRRSRQLQQRQIEAGAVLAQRIAVAVAAPISSPPAAAAAAASSLSPIPE